MNEHVNVITSIISLSAIWVALVWLYRDCCVDRFRQQMFALRDEMFDRAMQGAIPFDHKCYGMLRVSMNGFIRFAHQFSLAHFLIIIITHCYTRDHAIGFIDKFNTMASNLNASQQAELNSFRRRMNELTLRHIIFSSPLIVVTIISPVILLMFIRMIIDFMLRTLREPIQQLGDAAFAAGND